MDWAMIFFCWAHNWFLVFFFSRNVLLSKYQEDEIDEWALTHKYIRLLMKHNLQCSICFRDPIIVQKNHFRKIKSGNCSIPVSSSQHLHGLKRLIHSQIKKNLFGNCNSVRVPQISEYSRWKQNIQYTRKNARLLKIISKNRPLNVASTASFFQYVIVRSAEPVKKCSRLFGIVATAHTDMVCPTRRTS